MASMFAFASCGPDNPDTPDNPDPGKQTPTLTLSAANIDVSGIDGDYMAVVDNAAKTIKISLEYADKENAKALTVSFLTALFGTGFVYIAALAAARSKIHPRGTKIIESMAQVSNTLPGMVLGIAFLLTFRKTPLHNTIIILVCCN